ncbi:hypothetical protein [Streptomyces sp. NPDC057325]|uniref:hypothetical protein n=1 Tax=unclassified Streptomyces TaxID=2593676 RepID=UPI00362ED78A
MTDTPWYMVPGATDTSATDKGSPERNRKHVESIAESASSEADSVVSRLRASEAQGIAIPSSVRMAMGYSVNARKAAAQLGEAPQHQASASTDDITPEQRLARGYGSTN